MNFLDVVPCTYVRSVSHQTPPYEKTAGFTAIFWGEKSSHVKFANYLTDGRSGFTESCFSEQQSRCAEIWEITRFRAKPHGAEKSSFGGYLNMSVRIEIKAQIIRAGFTMQEVVDLLHDEYGWSDSVSNLSAKLQRESIRYKEVVELADALGYELIWQKWREK